MTKRHADSLLIIMQGFLREALALDKTLAGGLEKDYLRLESLVREHGVSVFTVMLPALSKELDRSLDAAFLDLRGAPLSRQSSQSVRVPRLFQGIWLKVFTKSGVLRTRSTGLEPTWVLILKSLLAFGKKIELECSDAVKFKTVKEFYSVDSGLRRGSAFWRDHEASLDRSDAGSLLDLVQCDLGGSLGIGLPANDLAPLLRLSQLIADRVVATRFGGDFSPAGFRFKHGPGATSEYPRGKGYKYHFPTWGPRLECSVPFDQFGVANPGLVPDALADLPYGEFEADIPSRLMLVPKDMRGPRLIAGEPTANQWAQQGLAHELVRTIRRWPDDIGASITFHRQSNSAYMALSGSRTAKLSTIDLSSASDRLSCWLVQRLFRGNLSLLRLLANTRTRFLSNRVDKKMPTVVELKKFATMGSALTFPVQSISFFILTVAAVCYSRGWGPDGWRRACRGVQVYGDDIVVPTDSQECLRGLLSAVGLKVNTTKSFAGLTFREACGIEAFCGYDITPAKPRHLFNADGTISLIACVDVSNLLHERGLWYAAAAVKSLAGVVGPLPMTRIGGGAWGDRSFVDPWNSGEYLLPARKRWDHDLQKTVYQFIQPKAKKNSVDRFEGVGNLLQYFTEDPSSQILTTWESGLVSATDAVITRRWVDRAGLEPARERSE